MIFAAIVSRGLWVPLNTTVTIVEIEAVEKLVGVITSGGTT